MWLATSAGLTPAQWGMMLMFLFGTAVAIHLWRKGPLQPEKPTRAEPPDEPTVDFER